MIKVSNPYTKPMKVKEYVKPNKSYWFLLITNNYLIVNVRIVKSLYDNNKSILNAVCDSGVSRDTIHVNNIIVNEEYISESYGQPVYRYYFKTEQEAFNKLVKHKSFEDIILKLRERADNIRSSYMKVVKEMSVLLNAKKNLRKKK